MESVAVSHSPGSVSDEATEPYGHS
jgi:hypothetical protein